MNATAGSGWKWLEVRSIIGLHLKRFRNIHNLRLMRAADGLLGSKLLLVSVRLLPAGLVRCIGRNIIVPAKDLVPMETVCE